MKDDLNLEKIIGLSETIDKAVDDYFANQELENKKESAKVDKENNYTIGNLKQDLINKLSRLNKKGVLFNYSPEIELLKIILENENK